MNLTPDSWGSRRLKEFNQCHEPGGRPTGGRFCSREVTRVGITTARTPGDPLHRPNRTVAEQMRTLEGNLKRLPGVRGVEVKPALGQWDGGSEFSFAVSYIGNGQARRMLAELGRAWNQDAVLLLRAPKKGETPDAAFEFIFERAVEMDERRGLAGVMGKMGFGGWTWYKRNGKTVLRLVSVPQWGGDNEKHRRASMRLGGVLSRAGHGYRVRELKIKAEVMERSGANSYDAVLGRRAA
jgi:hypothetical protein